MSIRFNVDEVLQMAVEIETNGARFYRRASERISDPAARQWFRDLAVAEDHHREVFLSMRSELSARERGDAFAPPGEDMAMYLAAWADGQVFDARKDAASLLTGKETVEEILLLALDREKDSVVFYVGLKEAVPKTWGRDRVDDIIREEMRHIAVLSTHLAALRKELH